MFQIKTTTKKKNSKIMKLFRNLNADEIEIRRSKKYDNGKVEILLYKNARCDMNILDETFGPYGWAKDYRNVDGVVYCGVALKDEKNNTWIWKWDAGAEQNFEKEKSQASDAFKRACFNWGVGRELYSAPRIVITPESDYETFRVSEITYDEKDRIKDLQIVNNKGKVVFNYKDGKVCKIAEPSRIDVLKAFCRKTLNAGGEEGLLKNFYNYWESKADTFDVWNEKVLLKLWDKYRSKNGN